AGSFLSRFVFTRTLTQFFFGYKQNILSQEVLGIRFQNPIGLAAGFDKDGVLTEIIPSVGFGFEEVGSTTAKPYVGNPRPRLWRLPKSKSLGVWYGLKNDGVKALVQKLKNQKHRFPIGISVAM